MSASVGASIGIAIVPTHATDAAGLPAVRGCRDVPAKLGKNSIETYDQTLDDDGNLLLLAEELRVGRSRQGIRHPLPAPARLAHR